MNDLYTGIQFARAVQHHLKLDGAQVAAAMTMDTGPDDVLAVNLTVLLGPDDLVAIGNLLQGDAPLNKAEQYEAVHVYQADGARHTTKVPVEPAKTNIGELTVKLDTSLVRDAIREMLEPGAMYLPAAAVRSLQKHGYFGLDPLIALGAVVAGQAADGGSWFVDGKPFPSDNVAK